MEHGPKPIYCQPQCIVRDYFTPRVVPVIHPVEIINRQNIVNIPHHIYQPYVRNVVVGPGYPTDCC